MKIAAFPRAALSGAAGLLLATMTAGCATPPTDPVAHAAYEQNDDPLEPMNRKILEFNMVVDRILLKPVAKVYMAVLPQDGRDGVRQALDNMKEPVVVINDILQGEFRRAGIAAGRFVINSTVGIAGFADVATPLGLPKETGDFGQTLYVWGFPEGPYLVMPLLGPTSLRDLIGMAGDNYIDPFSYVASAENVDDLDIDRFVVDGVDRRARAVDTLDALQKSSVDFYAELRSLSQQHRAAELRRGGPVQTKAGLYDDPGAASAGPPGKPPTIRTPDAGKPRPGSKRPVGPSGASPRKAGSAGL